MRVYVKGRSFDTAPSKAIGKGGEADVYQYDNDTALKIWKQPSHPDFQGFPEEQRAAKLRIHEYQKKIRKFPKLRHPEVIAPVDLATDKAGKVIKGFTMKFLKHVSPVRRLYVDHAYRYAYGAHAVQVLFRNLWNTVEYLHSSGVVVGDFNDLNILHNLSQPFLIDTDSYQFGGHPCIVFTNHFLDPLLYPAKTTVPMLGRRYEPESDWYAFAVMLFRSWLLVDPYGGVYRPKNKTKRLKPTERPIHRVTVFHNFVKYPKKALPWRILSDDLLGFFHDVFEKDKRGVFPKELLEQVQWQKCKSCGLEYSCRTCPNCVSQQPVPDTPAEVVRGEVMCRRLFRTDGLILHTAMQDGQLRYIYNEKGEYLHNQKGVVMRGDLVSGLYFRVQGDTAVVNAHGALYKLFPVKKGIEPERYNVDRYDGVPMFDTNGSHFYWVDSGTLYRSTELGSQRVGDVLRGHSYFWVGDTFGFGFYSAGELMVGFVFGAHTGSINDSVDLPSVPGRLLNASCKFSQQTAFLFRETQYQGLTYHHCTAISDSGEILAHHTSPEDDADWLGAPLSSTCTTGPFLFSATMDGIAKVSFDQGSFHVDKTYPDTEPFTPLDSELFINKNGLYVVNHQEIHLVTIGS